MSPSTHEPLLPVLVAHWHRRLDSWAEYLRSTFGIDPGDFVPSSLRLVRQADGSIQPENIGHMCDAVWIIESSSAEAVPLNHNWKRVFDTDDSGEFYLRPSYLFYAEQGEVLLSEKYGSRLFHRSLGRVREDGATLSIDWTTLWTTDPSLFAPPTPS